jgi:hypothetical protein
MRPQIASPIVFDPENRTSTQRVDARVTGRHIVTPTRVSGATAASPLPRYDDSSCVLYLRVIERMRRDDCLPAGGSMRSVLTESVT